MRGRTNDRVENEMEIEKILKELITKDNNDYWIWIRWAGAHELRATERKNEKKNERIIRTLDAAALAVGLWVHNLALAIRLLGRSNEWNWQEPKYLKKKRIADSIETNTFFLRHKSKLIQFFSAIHSSLLSYICCFFHVLSFPSC